MLAGEAGEGQVLGSGRGAHGQGRFFPQLLHGRLDRCRDVLGNGDLCELGADLLGESFALLGRGVVELIDEWLHLG